MSGVARGTVNAAGRLVAADPALATLHARAGGNADTPLAVVPLASIARLARRLGVVVSRPVTVADEEADVELWVRAQPVGDEVRLAVSGWRAQQPWPGPRGDDPVELEGWRWECDAALRLTHLALGAAARSGSEVSDLLGQPVTALFTLEADDAGGLPLIDALAQRVALRGQRARVRSGGKSVILEARVRRDAAGSFAGFVGTARAVDEAPPPAPPLSEAFTQGLDRALRRPLARIVANADSIHGQADGPIAPDYADYAADIAGAGRHLLSLIDDLADLQAIERADFNVPAEPIDLADLARRAAGLLSVRADNAGVTVLRPPLGATASAQGDFRRVLQILVNLVGNAIRYAPQGSAVAIELGETEGRRTVTVIDGGKGIAAEDAERVFEKFERVDPAEPGGSGLDLYIARRLARAMGGDLTLVSAPGRGARFTLALPTG